MIDPLKVLICIPAHDGKVELGLAGGLSACASAHLFGNMLFMAGCSDVSLARNMLACNFLQSEMEWLVFIDADIVFTERDFRYLMDYPRDGAQPQTGDYFNPEGTSLNAEGHALIVSAEYSKKQDDLEPAQLGLGFTRIHRSVFQTLDEMRGENIQPMIHDIVRGLGDDISDDPLVLKLIEIARKYAPAGEPTVQQFVNKGTLTRDYFIRGAIEANQWRGEDHGFFLLCKLCGIVPRIETRTRLGHIGRKTYPYVGSNSMPL